MNSRQCPVDGCTRKISKSGLCDPHREERNATAGIMCAFNTCERGALTSGLCGGHYTQKRTGVTLRPIHYGGHGTFTEYAKGCRCDECKEAKRIAQRKFNDRYKAKHGKAWSVDRRNKLRATLRATGQPLPDELQTRVHGKSITQRIALYERDEWTCHLCGMAVNRERGNNDLSPSLDHVNPVSTTGTPDNSNNNLRTAHRICNSLRADNPITPELITALKHRVTGIMKNRGAETGVSTLAQAG